MFRISAKRLEATRETKPPVGFLTTGAIGVGHAEHLFETQGCRFSLDDLHQRHIERERQAKRREQGWRMNARRQHNPIGSHETV